MFSWTAGGDEAEWEISYSTTSGDPENGTKVSVSSNPYELTGLTAETKYYASVRAKKDGEYSAWSNEVNFEPTAAISYTVNDGTATNSYIPVYGGYVDAYEKNEFIIPATSLTDMVGGTIKGLTFYLQSVASKSWGNANFKIYLKEVDNTTITSYTFGDSDTPVYTGALDATQSTMEIKFSSDYTYEGGNLLIGIYNTVKGTYANASFYGITAESGASAYGYNSSALNSVSSVKTQSFLPKTTFSYLATDGARMKVSKTALDFGKITAESSDEDKQKTFVIENAGNATLENIAVTYEGDAGVFEISNVATSIAADGDPITVTVKMVSTTSGNYTGTIKVNATGQKEATIALSAEYAANPATMSITLDDATLGDAVAFGSVGKSKAKTFKVTNDGDLKLLLTLSSDNTESFTVTPTTLEVAGGSTEEFTVTFNYNEAKLGVEQTGNITITPSNEGLTAKTVSVTGTSVELWSEDFSGNTLPEGWEITNTNYWTIANGVAKGTYNWNTKSYLITPILKVEEGQSLSFDALMTASYSADIVIEKSTDNGETWASCKSIALSDKVNYTTYTIDGLKAGTYRFRFQNDSYNLDNFEGFKLNNDPVFAIYADEECTTKAAETEQGFGFATEDATLPLYVKNVGGGTLNFEVTAPIGFTVTATKNSLAKGESVAVNITMPVAENIGYHEGNVLITVGEETVFTKPVKGIVVDPSKVYVDFTADGAKFPAGWNQGNWTISSTYADYTSTDENSTIQTTKLIAAAGEPLIIEAKSNSLGYRYPAVLTYSYSRDNGETWSAESSLTEQLTTDYQLLTISDIADAEAESNVIVRFIGKNVAIRRIYGFTQPNVAIMTTDAADYDFGMQTAAAEKVFTVKNEGFSTLTNIAAVLTTGTDYTVALSKTTLEPDEETTITVTQKFSLDNLGAHSDVLTITADDQQNVVVNLSGKTRDGSKLFVDFDNVGFPTNWVFSSAWNIYGYGDNKYAYKSGASTIVTTPLTVAEGEVMTMKAGWYSGSTGILKIRYSADGGVNWSDYMDFSDKVTTTAWQDVTVSGIPAGKVILEFNCNSIKLDDISGFGANAEMPVIVLTRNNAKVEKVDGAFPVVDFGSVNETQTAVYTLKNNGTANLVSTVTTTGDVTAAITGEGEGITIADNKVTLAAGKSATITVTMEAVAPFGAKAGKMTITSEDAVGTIDITYTAQMTDPTALFVDFENSTWPDGFYHHNYWSIYTYGSNGKYAYNYQSTDADMITPKLTVAGADDVLTFKAWRYSSTYAPTFKLYYSKNRVDWTEYDYDTELSYDEHKTIEVKGLEAGDYYLKFTGSRLCIDDLMGWHIAAVDHDLYVTTSNIPTAVKVPETSITATATVTSLIAAETGVYAKLFFNDTEVAAATAKDIAKNGTQTFTMTGNVPAEEGTYDAKIVVYYSDNSVAFTTATTQVEVAHTRTLNITAFTRTSEENVEADADNKFTATFDVTVQNTGTTDLTKEQVNVSVTDAEGNAYETMTATEALAKDATVTFNFTVTTSALEGGMFTFKAKENLSNTTFATVQTVNVTATAPKFELAVKGGESVEDGAAVNFGLVREATTKTYTITNSGLKALELVSITAPEGYETTALTDANKTIAINGTLDIDVTLKALQGKKSGALVFTYKVDDATNKTFTLNLEGQSIAEDTWVETFDTEISSDWTTDGWKWKSDKQAAYSNYENYDKYLMTPRLAANAGEELTFDVDFAYDGYSLKVEYSTDKTTWTEIGTYGYDARGTKTFTAPADGNYYLKFTGTRYALLDNLIGFRLNKPEHEIEIAASTVPTTGTQYADYTATVRLKENLNKAEEVTAKLYVDGKAVAETTETIAAKTSTTVSVTWVPQETIANAVEAYIEVTYAGGTLTTTPVNLTIEAPYELDEEIGDVVAGTYPSLLLNRTFAAGWNTVCLPFAVAAEDVEALFGEGASIYGLTGYVDGNLNFTKATSLEGGSPYIIYVKKAINEPIIVKNVSISNLNTTASYSQNNGAYFRGTYAPMPAGTMTGKYGVTPSAQIARGTAEASMKGFRAYIELPEGASARLNFFDFDGTTLIKTIELQDNADRTVYNLNGQRVESLKKGNLYIINGKKQIRK